MAIETCRDDAGVYVARWPGGQVDLVEEFDRETRASLARIGFRSTVRKVSPVRPAMRREAYIIYMNAVAA